MNIPIRMIGIATTIFWIFLIIFCVSAAYSAKDVVFDFREPITQVTSDGDLRLSMPIVIRNRGFYDLGHFNMTSKISSSEGNLITSGSTFIRIIPKGEAVTMFHNVTINVEELLQNHQGYLFNDTQMGIAKFVSMRIAQVIPIQASSNSSMPWGAPLNNLHLGTPQYSTYNATHSAATIPISFENHSPFRLIGTIQTRLHDGTSNIIAEGQTALDAHENLPYNGYLIIYVPTTTASRSGHFEVSILTPLFNYGPMVIPYG